MVRRFFQSSCALSDGNSTWVLDFLRGISIVTLNPTKITAVPIPPDLGLHTTLRSIGVKLTRDTTLNRFYPTNGTFFSFTSDFFAQGLGSRVFVSIL